MTLMHRAIVPFNDLGRSGFEHRAQVRDALTRVLDSGWFINGPENAAFESALSGYLGVGHVIGVGNGTDALQLAMRAVATPDRDTIVTAANAGGYATVSARATGLKVRYADINLHTHLLDTPSVASIVDSSVAAVVVTHLYGRVADIASLRAVCEPLGIRIIEDCAQSVGAGTSDGMSGSLGDLATFSFYPTKNLGALGDGGAIATNDSFLASRIRSLRQYGWVGKYDIALSGGSNSRLDELQAAVLQFRLPLVEAGNSRRRDIIGSYAHAVTDAVHVLPVNDTSHAGHLAVVVTDDAADLAAHLQARGIQTAVHFPIPDHRQAAFAAEYAEIRLPVTEGMVGKILSLPLFPELTDGEVEQVCRGLSDY